MMPSEGVLKPQETGRIRTWAGASDSAAQEAKWGILVHLEGIEAEQAGVEFEARGTQARC